MHANEILLLFCKTVSCVNYMVGEYVPAPVSCLQLLQILRLFLVVEE